MIGLIWADFFNNIVLLCAVAPFAIGVDYGHDGQVKAVNAVSFLLFFYVYKKKKSFKLALRAKKSV